MGSLIDDDTNAKIANGLARLDAKADDAHADSVTTPAPATPNIQPMGDLALIRAVMQEKTTGGIIMPETARGRMMSQVVEVGPGRITDNGTHIPPRFSPGQYVLIAGHAGAYPIDKDHVLVHDKDIIGVWRDGPRDS